MLGLKSFSVELNFVESVERIGHVIIM
jgi:hypothetical protein